MVLHVKGGLICSQNFYAPIMYLVHHFALFPSGEICLYLEYLAAIRIFIHWKVLTAMEIPGNFT